ncbi:RNase adapter RapZ [Sphingomonas sp. BIUV-7]|uniref:RNase adapter RapZ n=1 Tax=Sphingomonas natans TaxID=3063330 RepID=A0ABT8Y980_9SPHN|nr:RNase adapter RapZ [Sphingomonas sp. BIUV-7]MDO6414887.1 RNase adapter RapZ [Sphingomonas sp. BIUV-7]
MSDPKRVLLVTGMSGAGRTTALKSLEDMGWETSDNLPLALVDRLLASPPPPGDVEDDRPLAVGIDSRTRGFDVAAILKRVESLRGGPRLAIEILFLDCSGAVLVQRYSATRRRHPLALDRPAEDGIVQERELLDPLRDAADYLIDTSSHTTNSLQQEMRERFATGPAAESTLHVTSFGYSRGLPRGADLVFDCRFLRNPHWVPELRPGTGLDADVAAYVMGDPVYEEAVSRFEDLLLLLLPRYAGEGKSYINIAIGCTGGRHRSVHVATRIGRRLRNAGFSPTIAHRDLAHRTSDAMEGKPEAGETAT